MNHILNATIVRVLIRWPDGRDVGMSTTKTTGIGDEMLQPIVYCKKNALWLLGGGGAFVEYAHSAKKVKNGPAFFAKHKGRPAERA